MAEVVNYEGRAAYMTKPQTEQYEFAFMKRGPNGESAFLFKGPQMPDLAQLNNITYMPNQTGQGYRPITYVPTANPTANIGVQADEFGEDCKPGPCSIIAAIASCLLFFPLGMCAIYSASKANEEARAHHQEEAERMHKRFIIQTVCSFILGLIWISVLIWERTRKDLN